MSTGDIKTGEETTCEAAYDELDPDELKNMLSWHLASLDALGGSSSSNAATPPQIVRTPNINSAIASLDALAACTHKPIWYAPKADGWDAGTVSCERGHSKMSTLSCTPSDR